MKEIEISASRKYKVMIGAGLLDSVADILQSLHANGKVCIVTDDNVSPIYSEEVADRLVYGGYDISLFEIEAGEESKSLSVYSALLSHLATEGFTRSDTILALGGGVVGDLAGYAAATYLRGIRFVQVPTSLLAAIDSSVGGKTAVNLPQGKNLVGAFYQPSVVIFDTNTLKTLPYEEMKNGLGEGVKYALLDGGRIYEILQAGLTSETLEEFISLCVESKKRIVEADEKENGVRKLLNLGHTIAHALEIYTDFAVPHGQAVAFGVAEMIRLAAEKGDMSVEEAEASLDLIESCDLRTDYVEINELIPYMAADKKKAGKTITLVTLNGIGKPALTDVAFDEIDEYFEV